MPNEEGQQSYYFPVSAQIDPKDWKTNLLQSMKAPLFSGRIQLLMDLLQPLCVSDGIMQVKNGGSFFSLYRQSGKILIPGSSIKGAVRSYATAIGGELVAEKLFGKNSQSSLVFFEDVLGDWKVVHQGLPQQFAPSNSRGEVKLYKKHTPTVAPRSVHVFEALDRGQTLSFDISFKGLNEEQIGFLLISLGMDPQYPFILKIGRGKSLNLGAVSFCSQSVLVHDPKTFSDTEKQLEAFIQTFKNRFPQVSSVLLSISQEGGRP